MNAVFLPAAGPFGAPPPSVHRTDPADAPAGIPPFADAFDPAHGPVYARAFEFDGVPYSIIGPIDPPRGRNYYAEAIIDGQVNGDVIIAAGAPDAIEPMRDDEVGALFRAVFPETA